MTTPLDPTPEPRDAETPAPIDNPLPGWALRPKRTGELNDEALEVFIGPKWESTYKRKLASFREDPTFVPTWNWSAALVPAMWFLYRKLYLAFAAFVIIPSLAFRWITGSDLQMTATTLQAPENEWLITMQFGVLLSTMLAAGGTANWLLFRRARAAIRLVALQSLPEPDSTVLLRRIGGVNRWGVVFILALTLTSVIATLGA